jgi:GTP-binding protein Era
VTEHRAGYAVLAGRPNVGKSTLFNALCGTKLAIVTPKPQTTRNRILGVVHRPDAQIVWIDTPGLYRPKNELGRRMVSGATAAVREADVVVLVADATIGSPRTDALSSLPGDRPVVLALNKVDLVHPRERLLPLLDAYARAFEFAALVPISATRASGLDRLLDEVVLRLPEHPPYWGPDTLTDRPERFLVAELVREAAFLQLGEELPYSVAVSVDRFEEGERLDRISATLHVERDSQKRIVVGRGGARIKSIGTRARREIEALLGRRVHLELFVRVTSGWTDEQRLLDELGVEGQ